MEKVRIELASVAQYRGHALPQRPRHSFLYLEQVLLGDPHCAQFLFGGELRPSASDVRRVVGVTVYRQRAAAV